MEEIYKSDSDSESKSDSESDSDTNSETEIEITETNLKLLFELVKDGLKKEEQVKEHVEEHVEEQIENPYLISEQKQLELLEDETRLNSMSHEEKITLFAKCIHFANVKHAPQRRKNEKKDPYFVHCTHLVDILIQCGITDLATLMAALTHDTVEDVNVKFSELKKKFGSLVSTIVQQCSDDKKLDKITRKKKQIEHAHLSLDRVKLVKLADKYSNLYSILTDPPVDWSEEIKIGYIAWSYLVCLDLYGVSSIDGASNLDNMLKNLFEKCKIDMNNAQEIVNNYYLILENKEKNK